MPEEALSASLEDYLEAIFHIVERKQAARAKDISARLAVNGSSVTAALRALAERKLVNYVPYDIVTLTPKGKECAEDIVRRHEALNDFFVRVLGVDEPDAARAACDMEHAVPRNILERFIDFVEFMEVCPRAGAKWLQMFTHECRDSFDYEKCRMCISSCAQDVKARTAKGHAQAQKSSGGGPGLDTLEPGQKAIVAGIAARQGAKERMSEIGVTKGALIEVERSSASGSAMEVKVKGRRRLVNPQDAAGVRVELLQE